MKHASLHITVALILIGLLILLSDPLMVWMPMGMQMALLLGAAVLAALWAGFVMYERSKDEREALHRQHAGRVAYLAGIAVLTVALVVQGLSHAIDPWVSLALGVMVGAKLVSRFYFERYR